MRIVASPVLPSSSVATPPEIMVSSRLGDRSRI